MNKSFQTALKQVYNFTDKRTEIMWGHKNVSELVRSSHGRTRQTMSKNPDIKEEEKWEKDTKAQFGYGEITKVSLIYEPLKLIRERLPNFFLFTKQ